MFKKFIFVLVLIYLTLTQQIKGKRISEEKCEEYQIKKDDCNEMICKGRCLLAGGKKAKPGEFPHMAAIGWKKADGNLEFKCGGTLISEKFVLTAAHCLGETGNRPYLVRLGTVNIIDGHDFSDRVDIRVRCFMRHRDYNDNDIGLLKLAKDVTFDIRHRRPACLQQTEHTRRSITATGWGRTGTFGETSDHLMKVSLPIVHISNCDSSGKGERLNGDAQICAGGDKGKDTCQGDSGAPIQVSHENNPCVYTVIGFTSYGPVTCGRSYGIYTNVTYHLDWIEKKVWKDEWLERKRKLIWRSHVD